MNGLALAPGTWLALHGTPYRLVDVDVPAGTAVLDGPDGSRQQADLRWLLTHPGLSTVGEQDAPEPDLARLTEAPRHALDKAARQLAHVREVETGFQSGDPYDGTEPDPRYDPRTVPSVEERRRRKAAELAAPTVDPDLRMSYRTLERRAAALRKQQQVEAVDGRALKGRTGTRLAHEVLDAIEHVVERRRPQSNFQTLEGLAFQVRAHVLRVHPDRHDELLAASDRSIIRAAQSMYTPAELIKGKAKYRGTKLPKTNAPEPKLQCTRPGEIVMGDAKDLDNLLKNTIFEGAVRGRLIAWMDVFSCSIPEVRVVVGSEKAVDIAQSIRAIGLPKLMEDNWDDDLRWPFVGVPVNIIDELAGGMVAGVPFVQPQKFVIDNGRTYRAFVNTAAARSVGSDIVPARRLRAPDKARLERAFRTLDTGLCQHLQGYRGPDPSERGADVDAAARYGPREIEAIIRHWIASVWQRRPLDANLRPDWCPDLAFSPNQLFNFGIQQTGLPLRSLTSQEYAKLLGATSVKLHRGGFKVKKLMYDWVPADGPDGTPLPDPLGPWRNPDRREVETWGAAHVVKYDDRDRRWVWWKHPETGVYHRLTWRGMHGLEDFPAFNDKDADALAAVMAERRLDPLDGPALAEALLGVLRAHDPDWDIPTAKRARTAAAVRQQQAASAARDRGDSPTGQAPAAAGPLAAPGPAPVAEPVDHARVLEQARRKARTEGPVVAPRPAAPLGAGLGSLFDLPEDPPPPQPLRLVDKEPST